MEVTVKKVVEKCYNRRVGESILYFIKKTANFFWNGISILMFIALWELAPRAGWVPQTFIAPPSVVLTTLWELLLSGILFQHSEVSLFRAIGGFIAAAVIGIPLGFLLGGWFKLFERIISPILYLLHAVNPFSLFPVFILLFGIGEVSKVAIIFWVCLWPILLNTITGVKNVDTLLIKSARSMGVRGLELFLKVILPAASSNIFHGLKSSCSAAFFIIIAAEMIGASSGLGWLVYHSQTNYQIPKLFATTVTISALGLSLNYLFGRLERKLINWKENVPEY